ncbi:hypothetical protein BKA63DRAFT_124678 [Paraphoma chrysanthemicola]|nr:hypothetical protein BKA63DRAFT_124678 [Paraphoma chrysanthemicola]
MKIFLVLGALLLVHVPRVVAQQEVLSNLSPCAVSCFTDALSKSTCTTPDPSCMCTNAPLQAAVEQCVLSSCTVKEALTAQNATMTLCNQKPRDNSTEIKVTDIALIVIMAFFVGIRICYKFFSPAEILFGPDDYLIVVSLLFTVAAVILGDLGAIANGLGRDIWSLRFDQVYAFGKTFYFIEILYFSTVCILKMSFLFFYMRIFPGPMIQKIIWATIWFNILFGIGFVLPAIFPCRPISFFWTNWDGEHTGRCINLNAILWANAAISIAVDFWMLAIPLSQLMHLKLSWTKKAGVILMFCLGTFATVVSIIRLQFLISYARTRNPTWDQANILKWSTIEIATGTVCSCIPSIRIILARVLPRTFGSSYDTGARHQYPSANGRSSKGSGFPLKNIHKSGDDNAIRCTTTFELSQAHKSDDELELVQERYPGNNV